jgi:hypothetical protein
MPTELHKLTMSVSRVVKAFQSSYKLKDLSDEIDGIKDTFDKIIHEKLAGIDPKSLVSLIINKAKIVQLVLNDLTTSFNQSKAKGDKNATWADLTKLKKNIIDLRHLSSQLPKDIQTKAQAALNNMRAKLDDAFSTVDKYLLEVRSWKY